VELYKFYKTTSLWRIEMNRIAACSGEAPWSKKEFDTARDEMLWKEQERICKEAESTYIFWCARKRVQGSIKTIGKPEVCTECQEPFGPSACYVAKL